MKCAAFWPVVAEVALGPTD